MRPADGDVHDVLRCERRLPVVRRAEASLGGLHFLKVSNTKKGGDDAEFIEEHLDRSQLAQYVQSRCSERIQEFSACLHRYKDTADERCQRPFALMEQCSSFAHADFIASSSSSTA